MKLIMVSAGWENGGNTLQRHLDGHPNLFVYPFESMLGTPLSSNILTPAVPFRYCWPEFGSEQTALQAYHSFYDEEMKIYLRRRELSKFKNCGMEMDEKERIERFQDCIPTFSRKGFVEAYFESTFAAWKNLNRTGMETHYVGYIPGVLMDADKIFSDFPDAKIIHIIRNPWSGYADTIKRPFPQSLERYCQIWNIIQMTAFTLEGKYPNNFKTIHFEDLCDNAQNTMIDVCKFLEIPYSDTLLYPSFNGKKLDSIYPWGTIKHATIAENKATSKELSLEQIEKISCECSVMFGYIHEYGDINYWNWPKK